jgi:hypothetical protein
MWSAVLVKNTQKCQDIFLNNFFADELPGTRFCQCFGSRITKRLSDLSDSCFCSRTEHSVTAPTSQRVGLLRASIVRNALARIAALAPNPRLERSLSHPVRENRSTLRTLERRSSDAAPAGLRIFIGACGRRLAWSGMSNSISLECARCLLDGRALNFGCRVKPGARDIAAPPRLNVDLIVNAALFIKTLQVRQQGRPRE